MWDQIDNFHFLRPHLLLMIVPLLLLIYIIKNKRLKSGTWGRVCDEHLLPFLLIGQGSRGSRWALLSLALIGLALIVAFAGPTWEKLPQPVFRSQAALVIALDLSRSMDVSDIKPTRLARAKHKIRDILKQRREGQTALVVYAAEAFVVTPLTEDTNTVASLVKNLSTDLMPHQGSYPDKAILKSVELFKQASALNGHVLLLTDGIDSGEMDDAISQLTSAGHRLSIMGIGTEQGAPIADYRGGFVKSQDGSIVVARLDEAVLKNAASQGNGIYQTLTANDRDINRLIGVMTDAQLEQSIKEESSKLKLQSDQWREEGPWILLLLLPFIALAFRRGYLVLLVAVLIPMPQTSYAFDWSSLWKNQDQRAKSELEAGNHQQAAELFNDPQWKAAASYRAENYQQTLDALESAKTPDALYNKGNALAKLGNLQEAIQSYEQALKLDPQHEDAKYNRDLIKDYLEKNPDNQDQQSSDQKQNSDQQQDQENSQEQSQQENQQQSQQQDQSDDADSQQNQQSAEQHQDKQSEESSDNPENKESQQAEADEKENQEKQQQQQASKEREQQDESDQQQQNPAQMADDELTDEEKKMAQKTEQWLRRIPDDPGGLLRRKFRYQSELDSRQAKEEAKPW
jgi:Ca-activated chloride channel family protein